MCKYIVFKVSTIYVNFTFCVLSSTLYVCYATFAGIFQFILSAVMYLPDLKSHNYAVPYVPLLYVISYAIPGVLYTINNNIGLIMQLYMDPTTFQVLAYTLGIQKILSHVVLMSMAYFSSKKNNK